MTETLEPSRSRASRPRFKRVGEPERIELTDDDIAILKWVWKLRFVRADDLHRLFDGRSSDKLSRRLMRLYRSGILDRPLAQIDRYHQGGSKALVYGLDNAGAKYLKDELEVPVTGSDWRGRNRSYTRENLDHTLAVSRFMIDLELLCRKRPELSVISFEEILARAPESTRRSSHPGRWRVDLRYRNVHGSVHIIPDAIFGLRIRKAEGRSLTSYYFLEIDRGTMTIAPSRAVQESDAFLYRATMLRKFVTYAESFRQKLHEAQYGIHMPKVLTLTTSQIRAEAMRKVAKAVAAELGVPEELFAFGLDEVSSRVS
ncbi:MAG: replication-relaxation family protein [Rhizomicrobium sp.]